jgi:hypothetical protein
MANLIAGTPSIIGEQFPDFVVDQINQRQKIYGTSIRNNSQLAYLNSKTAWCSLASSVDIKNTDRFKGTPLENIESEITENKLASKVILHAGTARLQDSESNNLYVKAGISNDGSILNNNAYGFGGLEFGQVPMPGIVSANFRSENRGSLRTGEIHIKAYNRAQFEMIDTLFLRLGYTVLFEFGWSNYYDNKGTYQDDRFNLYNEFINSDKIKSNTDIDQYYFLDRIKTIREETNGNYDAMLAKVKNFNWSFNKDGSYDITLSVVSIGDIIESLQVNIVDPKIKETEILSTPLQPSTNNNIFSSITNWVINIFTKEQTSEEKKRTRQDLLNGDETDVGTLFEAFKYTSTIAYVLYTWYNRLNKPESNLQQQEFQIMPVNNKNEFYITFGAFCELIKQYVFITNEKNTSSLNIANSYVYYNSISGFSKTQGTKIYTHPDQTSCDLRICALNKIFNIDRGHGKSESCSNLPLGYLFTECESGDVNVGDLMKIYLNFRFILRTLESIKDENGAVNLIDFLTNICNGINNALGNINKISPIYDHDTNTISFVDETPLERDWIKNPAKAKFELYGYNLTDNMAGFIQDFTLKTELTPAMSTAISVGAQANAQPVGESQTSFTKWNAGLIDRIWKEKNGPAAFNNKITPEAQAKADEITKQSTENLLQLYNNFLISTTSVKSSIGVGEIHWNVDDFESYPTIMKSVIGYHNSTWASSNNSSGSSSSDVIGFIPINLSLTMEGLSGMKIYQRFNVDTKFLPSKYTDTLEFVVKGISHEIVNNKWATKIETFMVPKVVTNPTSSLFTLPASSINDVILSGLPIENGYYTNADNNPFNIRPSTDRWLGATGIKYAQNGNGGFVTFDTLYNGVRAGMLNLKSYLSKGNNTISTIINTYAPPKDKNNTSKYIEHVTTYIQKNGFPNFNPYINIISVQNEKLFKTLCKAIITEERENIPGALELVDSFDLKTLKSQ